MSGYCQGMNFVVGRLVKYLTEEEAFWVFTMLIESLMPLDYYSQMVGVQSDAKIFHDLIRECLPMIHYHFTQLHFDPMFFSLNWFICLFCDKLPEKVLLAVRNDLLWI